MRKRRLDPGEFLSDRQAYWLDARETLTSFMEGACPNRELLRATVGKVFERVLAKRQYLIVRGYGEMVDVLGQDGNGDGGIALEKRWNEFANEHAYSLRCGYSLNNLLHHLALTTCAESVRTTDAPSRPKRSGQQGAGPSRRMNSLRIDRLLIPSVSRAATNRRRSPPRSGRVRGR